MLTFIRRVIQKLSRDYRWSFLVKANYTPDGDYFTKIYSEKLFGYSESASGPGSDLEATTNIRLEIPNLLNELKITSIADIPCGDFFWISKVDLDGIKYYGFDIVPELILRLKEKYPKHHFQEFDATASILPECDLIICRDLLVHLTTKQAVTVIENFKKSGSKYLLATTFTETNPNDELIVPKLGVGWRSLNLAITPFNLGSPLQIINEESTEGRGHHRDKSLALWRLN